MKNKKQAKDERNEISFFIILIKRRRELIYGVQ